MVEATETGGAAPVTLTLYNDLAGQESRVIVTPALASLLGRADAWARAEPRRDAATLTFSSTLAAMITGAEPLCQWLRLQISLRGASTELVTKGRWLDRVSIPNERLTTTVSFRKALEQAQLLAQPATTIDVRHLMAAYPVVRNYHAADFVRFRIDRRAWCLALSEHLQSTYPDEAGHWRRYASLAPEVLLPNYRPDVPGGPDLLGVGREVEAFSMLIASTHTQLPLSIGVFGAWGSGKSYFMARVEERVAALAAREDPGTTYRRRIAQVRFNAWHYSEGDVVASLVDHIFRNLRFGPHESDVQLSERRRAALAQVAQADRLRAEVEREADAATTEEARLRTLWQETLTENVTLVGKATQDLTAAQAAVGIAERALQQELSRQQHDILAAQVRMPAAQTAQVMTDAVFADPRLAQLRGDLTRLWKDARWLGANRATIAWGLLVALLAGLATSAVAALRETAFVTSAIATLVALLPFAFQLVKVLRDLAAAGAAFETAVQRRLQEEIEQIHQRGAAALLERQASLDAARLTVQTLQTQIDGAVDSTRQAQAALDSASERRQAMSQQLADAASAAVIARSRLDATTLGSLLGDTIREAGETNSFRGRLGVLAEARSLFQRLSETMRAARMEAQPGSEPVLERVVLYIDDLDRCEQDQVRRVLQAVHLLLAFDLFACVIAVDPRWIVESLEASPGVNTTAVSGDDLRLLGGRTTASDYLEKIIQIPLWLRPVPADRRAALATSLLQDEGDGPVAERRDRSLAGSRGPAEAPPSDAISAPAPADPRRVRITSNELDFLLGRVAPLLDGNSRALKRFVNTYQLVRASLSEVEFDSFANEAEGTEYHRPYRVCMAQLALLSTQRRRGHLLATLVDERSAAAASDAAKAATRLGAWLDELATSSAEVRAIAADLKLVLLPELQELPFDRFSGWFERTRRYSFYA